MKLLGLAISIAATAHVGQLDKGGQPYILHPLTVMHKVKSECPYTKQVAVLHDVLEDSDVTLDHLKALGFSHHVLVALELLTHSKDQRYESYIIGIGTDLRATLVKLADLRHNSDLTRLKGVTDKDLERMAKYQRAYVYLTSRKLAMLSKGYFA